MATKKTKTTTTTSLQQLADAAESAYAALTPKEREAFHARFEPPGFTQQVEVINSLTLAVMASTGCDETTAQARIEHASQQVMKARELKAADDGKLSQP